MLYTRAFFLIILFASCALHKSVSTGTVQYQRAVAAYETKDYHEALRLLEDALPQLRGKEEEASAHFYRAYCSFHRKEYVQSSERFKYFYKTFFRDPRQEEALYMRAYTLYRTSPHVELDQATTRDAVRIFNNYLHHYPDGSYADQAREQLNTLNNKLAQKDFNSAKLYYQLNCYKAAVVSLINFQKEFPTSSYSEEVAYLKAVAQYHFSEEVQDREREEQLRMAVKYCQEFIDYYSDSVYTPIVSKLYASLYAAKELKTSQKSK